MPYLTKEEYQELTGGDVPANFDYLEERAGAELDSVTRFFYAFHDLDNDIPFRRRQFKRAVALQIKFFVERGTDNVEAMNNEPDSVTVGATTVTKNRIMQGVQDSSRLSVVSQDSLNALAGTGLLYRGGGGFV